MKRPFLGLHSWGSSGEESSQNSEVDTTRSPGWRRTKAVIEMKLKFNPGVLASWPGSPQLLHPKGPILLLYPPKLGSPGTLSPDGVSCPQRLRSGETLVPQQLVPVSRGVLLKQEVGILLNNNVDIFSPKSNNNNREVGPTTRD